MNFRLLNGGLLPFLRFGIYCLILPVSILAQERKESALSWQETGLPYIQNFSPKDYGASPQNWCVAEGPQGIIYVGNTLGLLSFDGVSWRLYETPKKTAVRSIAIVDERIYVGSQNELGYFAADSIGDLKYFSLVDSISAEDRIFNDVWQIVVVGDTIFFRTINYIFYYVKERMHVWYPQDWFHSASVVNNTFFVQQMGVGLMMLVNDSLEIVPDGEQFAHERIYAIVPFEESGILIGTSTTGIFLYDGTEFKPFRTDADNFLFENKIYHGAKLPNDYFAFATRHGGAAIIDNAGNFRQTLNRTNGLTNENVRFIYPDRQGGIWLALNNGLARVETPAPYSRFKAESGITSMVVVIGRYHEKIYAATHTGVKYFDTEDKTFKAVKNSINQSWHLLGVGDKLLAATNRGILEVWDTDAQFIDTGLRNVKCLYQSRSDSSIVFASHPGGLAVLKLVNKSLVNLGQVEGVVFRATEMAEEQDGVLWLGTPYNGVYKVAFNSSTFSRNFKIDAKVTHFTQEHGLPERWISPVNIDGRTLFLTRKGLKHFDDVLNRFVADSTLGIAFADTACEIGALRQGPEGHVWAIAKLHGEIAMHGKISRQADGNYEWQGWPILRINDIGQYFDIYPDQNGTVWIGGSEGIACYDATVQKDYAIDYPALIRRVQIISGDSLIYGGAPLSESIYPQLPYQHNALRFEFAAPSYDDISANHYQSKLDGFNSVWSEWTKEVKKDYTNLSEGPYIFRVRAQNVYRQPSDEAQFAFQILPPWYRTWWAYLLYVMLAISFVVMIVKSRVRHLEKKTAELEAIVAERTATISEQAEKLKELDRMKSRFFANISHEFRTPLTLILGPLEERLAKARKSSDKEELGMMHRSANRVLRLINQLLDLSRLEAGRMKLRASQGDFVTVLRGIVMSFASLAEQKKITLKIVVGAHCNVPLQIYFDTDKIEKVFNNLLSNAFKFTPEGGNIIVGIGLKSAPTDGISESIEISVKDTGIGIPTDRLPHIFDRFYQIDNSATRKHEGTGIGLALTKELVELHHGMLEVKSEEGKGTEFIVRLPLEREHLSEDELVEASAVPVEVKQDAPKIIVVTEPSEDVKPSENLHRDATVVLVVDDHSDVRGYIRSHLVPDYEVIEADDGRAGVETAMDAIPDLIISDVMMPEMDGYKLCSTLKTDVRTSHIPVILLTAKAGEEDKLSGLETGADDYLTKPFNYKELQARVHNLILQRRKLQERFRREGILQRREIAATSVDEAFLHRLMSIIEEHLDEEGFGVETLSEKLNLVIRQIQRKIRALTGRSPVELIRLVRLQRAKHLLEQKAGSVSEIAFQVGFSSLSYFSKTFKEEFGKLPSEI